MSSLFYWHTYYRLFFPLFFTLLAYFTFQNGFPKLFLAFAVSAMAAIYNLLPARKFPGAEKYKTIIIGGGMSGINMGVQLKKMGMDFVILEKSGGTGGTWWHNRYPGAACDIPSHFYSFSYMLNPWWTHTYSTAPEINEYTNDIVDYYGLRDSIELGCEVTKAKWDERKQLWLVSTKSGKQFKGNFLIQSKGALHLPSTPNFEGKDSFKGRSFHSAEWPKDVSLKDKRVAIIGTGASSVQIVPTIADEVKSLHVFQRTPCWSPPRFDRAYPEWFKVLMAVFPPAMLALRWWMYLEREFRYFVMFRTDSFLFQGEKIINLFKKHIRHEVKDQELAEKLIPNYDPGCKRITPADHYYASFNKSHVHLVTDGIGRITEKGIETKKGEELQFDVIAFATGFSLYGSFNSVPVFGKGGKDLEHDHFVGAPKCYNGVVTVSCLCFVTP